MSEKKIQNEILRTYGTRADMLLIRMNAGVAQYADPKRFVRFAPKGYPDIQGILQGGKTIYIECKSKTGRQTPEQAAFQRTVEALGAIYVLARSVSDVTARLKQEGIQC